MKYDWNFDVVNRPSNEKDGVTKVSQDFTLGGKVAGEIILVGTIVKSRGTAIYSATAVDGFDVGSFDTRSQAAHALRKYRVATATKAPTKTKKAVRTVSLTEAPKVLGITIAEVIAKIDSGELKTVETEGKPREVIIDELGGEAA